SMSFTGCKPRPCRSRGCKRRARRVAHHEDATVQRSLDRGGAKGSSKRQDLWDTVTDEGEPLLVFYPCPPSSVSLRSHRWWRPVSLCASGQAAADCPSPA